MTVAVRQRGPEIDRLGIETVVAVLDALPVAALVMEGEELYCNRAAETLTGYDRDDLSSVSSFCSRLFRAQAQEGRRVLEADRRAGFPAPREYGITRQDGTELIIEVTGSVAGRVLCTMQDVTSQRRQTEERLADRQCVATEALLQAIIDSVPFDFFALDREGRYTLLSGKTHNIWGDAIGKTVPEFAAGTCSERYVPRWLENNRRALAGETLQQEWLYEWQGEKRVAQEVIGPIRDSQGEILGTFGVNIDITSHKLTQQALAESEDRYRRLSCLTSDYVYCCSSKEGSPFRVRWMGGAVEEITGYSEAEIYEHGCWIDFVHEDDRERMRSRLLRLKPGESSTDEFRMVCKNGEICWIRESCRCEAGDAEGELCLFGASRNITSSKQVEIALKNVEEIFRLFLEYSPAYVVFKDENQKLLRLSRNFEGFFGRPLDELIGKSAVDLFPTEVAERIMREDLKVLSDGWPIELEDEYQGRHYSSMKFAIPQKGKPALVAVIKTDVTARKMAEEALCRLNEKLDRRVAERTAQLETAILEQEAFSYSVSHDLRAPLRHINSFSAILMEDYADLLPSQGRDYLDRICQATSRMGVLIDNLLTMSRVSRTMLSRSRVNLSDLAAGVALMLKEIDPERVVEFAIAPHLHASCDKVLVRQLIQNLLANAWKYTAKKPAARIEFGMIASKEGDIFFVKDNGAGFDMIYKEKLFIPFQRLHGAEFEGSGIGLATAQRIAQRHGGSIWAEGEEGVGARFYFTLP